MWVRNARPEKSLEASALQHAGVAGLHGRSPLLRLQSDERLVALIRRGNHHAFEALVARYQSRLLAFCRHMLSSREDAEDVLQEVFAAAFNAMLADEREINVRPWLYRIARNRSLNHLRRAQAVGMDSMDVHLSEGGLTTADKVHKREEFRLLIADVQDLPETQRTALLLREIDALSYDQIAEAMETTVPSVKSLLVRARVSLAEAAEARLLSCDEVRLELGEVAEGLTRTTAPVRRHLRTCERCTAFRKQLRHNNRALAALLPGRPAAAAQEVAARPPRHDGRRRRRHRGRVRRRLGRRRRRAPGRLRHDRQPRPPRAWPRPRSSPRAPSRSSTRPSRAPSRTTAVAKVAPAPPRRRAPTAAPTTAPLTVASGPQPDAVEEDAKKRSAKAEAKPVKADATATPSRHADRRPRRRRPRATAATRRRCRPTRSAPPQSGNGSYTPHAAADRRPARCSPRCRRSRRRRPSRARRRRRSRPRRPTRRPPRARRRRRSTTRADADADAAEADPPTPDDSPPPRAR